MTLSPGRILLTLVLACLLLALPPTSAQPASTAGRPAGYWQCWYQVQGGTNGCRGRLYSLSGVSSSDVWAVGPDDMIAHWDDTQWRPYVYVGGESADYETIQMPAPDDGWITGSLSGQNADILLRWDGVAWSQFPISVTSGLHLHQFLAPDDGWMSGADSGGGGIALHWDGASWSQVPSYSGSLIQSMSFAAPDDGWAASHYGEFHHWDGADWTLVTIPVNPFTLFSDLSMQASNEGWAISCDYDGHYCLNGTIWHWDGTVWVPQWSDSGTSLSSLVMRSAGDGWVTGSTSPTDGVLLHWDGSSWNAETPPDDPGISVQAAVGPNEVWATTWDGPNPSEQTIWRWNGQSWVAGDEVRFRDTFAAVAVVAADDAWLAGSGAGNSPLPIPYGVLFHWDGAVWTRVTLPEAITVYYNYTGLAFSGPNDGWLVGTGGLMVRWNGGTWQQVTHSSTASLNGVAAPTPGVAWAVGAGGTILYWNGTAWTQLASPTSATLRGVVALGPGEAWAVGDGGTIIHGISNTWTLISPPPTPATLRGVAFAAPDDGWAAGDQGVLLHWDGASWTPEPSPTTEDLYSVALASPSVGVATGADHTFLEWDGAAWKQIPPPFSDDVFAVSLAQATGPLPATIGWGVGERERVARYVGGLEQAAYLPLIRR